MTASEHPYHRSVAPMMWVFVALASVELVVVHLLIALYSWRIALAVSLVTLAGLFWLVGIIRSFRRLPVRLDADTLVLRAGRLRSVTLPLANIAGVREHWEPGAHKARGTLNLALIAYPNLLIDLQAPVKGVESIGQRFDAPAEFLAALAAARGASCR